MTTDDFLLDQVERSQRYQTRRRREGRWRRRQLYAAAGLAAIALLALGGPSLISHSSIGGTILSRTLAGYGLQGTAETMRIGWITPLQVTGLQIQGTVAGSRASVQQLDMDLTVMDLIGSGSADLGQITLRGVNVSGTVGPGASSSIEQDLQTWWQMPSGSEPTTGLIKVQDVTVALTDATSGDTWQVSKSNADVELAADRVIASFAGVLSEPSGSGGSLQGSIQWIDDNDPSRNAEQWQMDIHSESLPLSVVTLVGRRFPDSGVWVPSTIAGDATGAIRVVGAPDGAIEAAVTALQVRNLMAADGPDRVWRNSLATLDGELILVGNRVIGRRLQATSDFASATLDGAFSRTFSLVGTADNPLRWLEAIDGKATAELDLAKMEQSLPGVLPLRESAELVSGRVVAALDSSPAGAIRRSKLTLRSDAVRARAEGRAVMIDPIELSASVSSDRGQIHADQFEWKSAFGSALGQGDLRAGNADVEIDFGRLITMLRPVIEISETSLAGAARGKIRWNASADNVWRLSGDGDATNLLIALPGGQTLRRQAMRGEVEAVGRWGDQSLEELTRASVTLASSGLDLRGELLRSVRRPSATMPLPIRIQGTGQLETLRELLGPWLPTELADAAGSFSLDARGEVSTIIARLSDASVTLTQPKVLYADRFFSQPNVKLDFSGLYSWPEGNLDAKDFVVAGDAFSMRARGTAIGDKVDMEIGWRAKLERLQGSVQKRMASRGPANVQQVGYRVGDSRIETEQWLVVGDCEGSFRLLTKDGMLDIHSDLTGKNLSVVQPPEASAAYQTVGPMPTGRGGQVGNQPLSRVVWAEPNLKIKGSVRRDPRSGAVLADQVQVSGDWFATTLTGKVLWNETQGDVRLQGPSRLKMNEVARLLTALSGTEVRAEGIHETPLDIHARRAADGSLAFTAKANLGWESGQLAGVAFGPASIPIRLTETSVDVTPSRIPVGQGFVNLAGQVHYRPGPMWMQVDRGVVAESVRLTPEMTAGWLKYLAPLAANATRIDGTFSAELDEALVVFDQPERSRVVGRLIIDGAQMNAGPLANQILGGFDQLKALAGALGSPNPAAITPVAARNDRTLISMRPQTVDFSLDRGIVTHERLYFDIDRAELVTSGQVALDGRLNLMAQVPLDARWLGRDLQGLAGQAVTLPIDGTLSRPSLDSAGVRKVVAELGAQTLQNSAENLLQKQLGRGIDKIFGR